MNCKLTKAPEGGSLGDFQGQKVKAEMDFPDGHKAKNLESGKCAICTTCETLRAKFGDELDLPKNKKLNDDLKKIEAELKAKPGDPDLIAKQKAMHDKLYKDKLERLKAQKEGLDPNSPKAQEIEAEINTTKSERVDNTLDIYDQKVKNGQNTRKGKTDAEIEQIKADVQAELDGGRVMNPESGKFHADGTSGPKIDDATRAKVEAGTTSKGKNRTPNEGTPEMEAMSANKADAKKKIEQAETDALNKPDHELKKAESFESRHPEAEHRKNFEKEYDDFNGGAKDTPEYKSARDEAFKKDRQTKRQEHSDKYDRGAQNTAKGDAFEDARLDQLNAEGGNFKKRKPSEKIEFEYDGQKVVVSPDLEDLAPPGGYIEMKSGKLSLTPEVEDQILRYAQLSQTNKVKITYELMDGASDSVIQAFEKYGIDYIDYSKIP